jgi:hypothetical protein
MGFTLGPHPYKHFLWSQAQGYGFDNKTIEMLFEPKTKLKKNVNKDDEMVKIPYQQVVGSLMYAMCIQPGLAYPISVVSQHMANPSLKHWMVVKRIF